MTRSRPLIQIPLVILLTMMLVACSTPPSSPMSTSGSQPAPNAPVAQTTPPRTLVAAVRVEPATVAERGIQQAGVALYLTRRLFNAQLAYLDPDANARLYLAETMPELGMDSWKVFPDGKMETTYRLKPDLVWHDGARLTAEDFVFAHQVYKVPEFGLANASPMVAIEEITAADPRTLVIRWNRPYPDAGTLATRDRELPPLPRHILQSSFQTDSMDAFANHPFWTREYVGAGPYRLTRWEPGSFLEATAFDRHVLGRARVERVQVRFISDANTVLANMLAGEVHLSADTSLRLEQGVTLRREWGPRNGGTVLEHPNQWRAAVFQLRSDLATPRAILDSRVRKALAHAVDKEGLNEALYSGTGVPAESIMSPRSRYGPEVDRAITKYAYDLRRSEQLMTEAGFTRAPGGIYTHPTEGRFVGEVRTNAAADNESEMLALASGWQQAGFEFQNAVTPAAQAQDPEVRATFASVYTNNTSVGEATAIQMVSSGIPTAANRWRGSNRGGWSNAEYDRMVDAYEKELDTTRRSQLMVQMMRIFNDELPAISLFFRTQPWAHVAPLQGIVLVAPESSMAWNIHEWELR